MTLICCRLSELINAFFNRNCIIESFKLVYTCCPQVYPLLQVHEFICSKFAFANNSHTLHIICVNLRVLRDSSDFWEIFITCDLWGASA